MLDHKQGSINLRKLKSCQASFPTTCYETRNQLQEKNCKKHKYMEAKQYVTKQPMDHWRNQRGNQKIPRDKWQQKHCDSRPMDIAKAGLRGKFRAIQAYLRKQEKSQIA